MSIMFAVKLASEFIFPVGIFNSLRDLSRNILSPLSSANDNNLENFNQTTVQQSLTGSSKLNINIIGGVSGENFQLVQKPDVKTSGYFIAFGSDGETIVTRRLSEILEKMSNDTPVVVNWHGERRTDAIVLNVEDFRKLARNWYTSNSLPAHTWVENKSEYYSEIATPKPRTRKAKLNNIEIIEGRSGEEFQLSTKPSLMAQGYFIAIGDDGNILLTRYLSEVLDKFPSNTPVIANWHGKYRTDAFVTTVQKLQTLANKY